MFTTKRFVGFLGGAFMAFFIGLVVRVVSEPNVAPEVKDKIILQELITGAAIGLLTSIIFNVKEN